MPTIEIAEREDADFVRNEGRLFYGSTFARYEALRSVADPLPASALLAFSLEEAGAPAEHARVLRAIQRRTRVHANAWSVKWDGERFAWEVYHPLFPPTHVRLYGEEMPRMRLSKWVGDLGFFLALHEEVLGSSRLPFDQAGLAIPGSPYALSFALDGTLASERRIERYSICTIASPPGAPLPLPIRYEGYAWRPAEGGLALEQVGVTVEPFEHEAFYLEFLAESSRAAFAAAAPEDPRRFLAPWLVENTGRYRVGASHKRTREELGIYYCGVSFPTFLRYLGEFAFPAPFVRRVSDARDRLAHLCFDVLVSWGQRGGTLAPRRTSFYGMF